MSEAIKETCLHDRHLAAGAQMTPFGGFDMPLQYAGIVEEHNAVRHSCGVFDVSHMGEVEVSGSDACRWVNHIFTNEVSGIPAGKIVYGMMLYPDGGVVDDLLVYRLADDRFLLVINAANIDKDLAWMKEHTDGFDVVVTDLSDSVGELAVQGPDSESVMEHVLGIGCSQLTFYTFETGKYDGQPILVSRTGYTGEDGFEIYAPHDVVRSIWDRLMESGKCAPCGLGCRDTLRFEVGLPLYGDELDRDITPLEAALGIFVKLDKPEFIGRDALIAQKEAGLKRKLVGIELADRAVPRHGYEVLDIHGNTIGMVTTGYRGISVDASVAMAFVDIAHSAIGTPVQVRIRRKVFPAVVTKKRFYDKKYKR